MTTASLARPPVAVPVVGVLHLLSAMWNAAISAGWAIVAVNIGLGLLIVPYLGFIGALLAADGDMAFGSLFVGIAVFAAIVTGFLAMLCVVPAVLLFCLFVAELVSGVLHVAGRRLPSKAMLTLLSFAQVASAMLLNPFSMAVGIVTLVLANGADPSLSEHYAS